MDQNTLTLLIAIVSVPVAMMVVSWRMHAALARQMDARFGQVASLNFRAVIRL